MNKKIYQMPCVKVVNIKISRHLLYTSPGATVGDVSSTGTGLRYGGASGTNNPSARGRGGEVWDDED